VDQENGNESSYTVDTVQNQSYLRQEIVATLSKLFPDKVGDIETLGKSVYGITFFDADNFDEEIQILKEYNAQRHNFEVRNNDNTLNTTLEFYTFMFMEKEEYPPDILLNDMQVERIQQSIHTDLSGLNNLDSIFLVSADLSGVNCNGSTIRNSVLSETNFFTTKFADSQIMDTNFTQADMRYAKFEVSTLTNVNFYKADLRHADFSGSVLKDVDLRGADLRYANLEYVSIVGKCLFNGATVLNLSSILQTIDAYPPGTFDGVINIEEDENDTEEEDEDEGESLFLTRHRDLFSSADVKVDEDVVDGVGVEDVEDDEENINNKPPICADIINGYDLNIQSYLNKDDANFTIQLPESDNYECINLNDIKRYHIKTDKSGKKYFNYVYACNADKPYLSITEENYQRAKSYIRMGSFNFIVEKPDWFPQAKIPIYRKFKLVKTENSPPAFVSETMIRHGEKGDVDYITSEWHCNAGKMDTYKLEPLLEGGRRRQNMTRNKKMRHKKTKVQNNNKRTKKHNKRTKKHNKRTKKHNKRTKKHNKRTKKQKTREKHKTKKLAK
jgi:uncharacterized protein YjbI with pentapeptide repeats